MIQTVAPATVWLKLLEGLTPVGCTTQPTATAAVRGRVRSKRKGNFAQLERHETQRRRYHEARIKSELLAILP